MSLSLSYYNIICICIVIVSLIISQLITKILDALDSSFLPVGLR